MICSKLLATCLTLVIVAALFVPRAFGSPAFSRHPKDGRQDNPSDESLVIIMLDGFRWDYAERLPAEETPNFERFKSGGVHAEYVQPIFPANSFPSWTTIVTGLYPEDHGILDNYMFDPLTGEEFRLDTVGTPHDTTGERRWWDQHIPLWTSATAEGIKTRLYYWSRCDVPFVLNNVTVMPDKCIPFESVKTNFIQIFRESLAEAVHDLLTGTGLVFVYFNAVDEAGHVSGPDSDAINREVRLIDDAIGGFLDELELNGLSPSTNVVVTSDHGMTATGLGSSKTSSKITEYTDAGNLERVVGSGPFANVKVKEGVDARQVASELQSWPGVHAFLDSDLPEFFHYSDNELIHDILIISTNGSELIQADNLHPEDYLPEPSLAGEIVPEHVTGDHGYNDITPGYDLEGIYPDMRSIFYALGPKFKPGCSAPWIKLVDQYQVFKHVLGIDGEEHSGSWDRVKDMMMVE